MSWERDLNDCRAAIRSAEDELDRLEGLFQEFESERSDLIDTQTTHVARIFELEERVGQLEAELTAARDRIEGLASD